MAIGAAIALGAGGLVFVGAALPAQATTCTYDAFYTFDSTYASLYTGDSSGTLTLGDYSDFCQYRNNNLGGNWFSWLEKGTSDCLTVNNSTIVLEPCSYNSAYQQFLLEGQIGSGENWTDIKTDLNVGGSDLYWNVYSNATSGDPVVTTAGSYTGWSLAYDGT